MKTLKLCLLASILMLVQSAQGLAQKKVQTLLKQNPVMEEVSADAPKPAGRTITWFSQEEEAIKVLDLESPNLNKEFNRMVEEMDHLYHGPGTQVVKEKPELGRAEGNAGKIFLVRGPF